MDRITISVYQDAYSRAGSQAVLMGILDSYTIALDAFLTAALAEANKNGNENGLMHRCFTYHRAFVFQVITQIPFFT